MRVSLTAIAACLALSAATAEPLRVAIIDTSKSTIFADDGTPRPELIPHLKKSGVLVIGRYYGRCQQYNKDGSYWRKRLTDGDPRSPRGEAEAILNAGFAILSIFQYKSTSIEKFTKGLGEEPCTETRFKGELAKRPPPAVSEGMLDAEAALTQAGIVGQPRGSAIYFGVDFDFDMGNAKHRDAIVSYFREVKRQLDAAGFRLGAYGNGDALTLLLGETPYAPKLIEFAWLSASMAYKSSPPFYEGGRWDLFQTQVDLRTMTANDGACVEYEYDTNVQNPKSTAKDLGFWNRKGTVKVPEARTNAVFLKDRPFHDPKTRVRRRRQKACPERTSAGPEAKGEQTSTR
jgi:hypothetical protein